MTDTTAGEGVVVYGDERDELLAMLREKCPNLYALPECPPDDLLKVGEDSRADEAIQREFDRAKALAAQPSAGAQGEAWSKVRTLFMSQAERFVAATRYEEASIIADKAARDIVCICATPAQPDTGDVAALREALEKARERFEGIRRTLINHLEEPERQAFWSAVHGRTGCDDALAALSKPNAPGREG